MRAMICSGCGATNWRMAAAGGVAYCDGCRSTVWHWVPKRAA